MSYKIQILYKKTGASKKHPEPFIVLYDPPSWPSRTMERRGYDRMEILWQRDMTEAETRERTEAHRCTAYKYMLIDELILDETAALGPHHPEIEMLTNLKTKTQQPKANSQKPKANSQQPNP